MDRHISTLSLEVPTHMKEEINKAIRDLHFHTKSELIRAGIRKVLDEVKIKKQIGEKTTIQ